MRISEVAGLTGLNVSNIRFYERKGLLTPVREEESRYRDYTEEDVRRIKRILLYRKMGIPVEPFICCSTGRQKPPRSWNGRAWSCASRWKICRAPWNCVRWFLGTENWRTGSLRDI